MKNTRLIAAANEILEALCVSIGERPVGSEGNRQATDYVLKYLQKLGWAAESIGFDAVDWNDGGASLRCGDESFSVLVSPYSNGFRGEAALVHASSADELEILDAAGKFILLHGAVAAEQLMPKNFVFYNPESHQRIIAALEKSGAKAIICATGRNPSLAGGVYPFPLIEDGDFDIPSVYMTEDEGLRLKKHVGEKLFLESLSERVPGKGYNVIARKGNPEGMRVVLTAHVDAKKGTTGAIDNATGVTVLLLLAELLNDYRGNRQIEIAALNGEDYYAVPGQMSYITSNYGKFGNILLNINIDGAGYKEGITAFSLFDLPGEIRSAAEEIIRTSENITEGVLWPQGDHSIFLQSGVPAIAVTSKWFLDNIDRQEITHTPADNISVTDCTRLAGIAEALSRLIRMI